MKKDQIRKKPLQDTVIEALEPENKVYRVHDGNGLYLRVSPNGFKSWQFRFKESDKWKWTTLGKYPLLKGNDARMLSLKLKKRIDNGGSINTENNKDKFNSLFKEWIALKAKSWTDKTRIRNERAIEIHVIPKFGDRAYKEITPLEWMRLFDDIQTKGILEQLKRVRTGVRDIYNLAKVTGRIDYNPIEGLEKFIQSPANQNYSHVPISELPALISSISNYKTPDIRIGLLLLAMLAVRPSELREATWSEFDLKKALWTIPAERMKMGRTHLVPLPKQALTLLKELKKYTGYCDYILVGRSDSSIPRSDGAFLMALKRLGYNGKQTAHGFRHIFSTVLNEHGFNKDHIEAQLAHVSGGVRGIYNKAQYLEQRRELMQWYADYLGV